MNGIHNWLGVPDNNPGITWEYGQRKGNGCPMAEVAVIGRTGLV